MAKFKRSGKGGMPAINTASLPDIVFMLLFFFMVTTVVKESVKNVNVTLPEVTQAKKLEDKSLVSHIYIGTPARAYQEKYGTEPRIQLNDQFKDVNDIRDFIFSERQNLGEADQAKMTVSLKIDNNVQMGVVTDVKISLREAGALKINYAAKKNFENN
ncbi:MAG: ExbD/TolR family protein [Bacteroidota bacterium]